MTKLCRKSKKRKYNSRAAALRAGTQRYGTTAVVSVLASTHARLAGKGIVLPPLRTSANLLAPAAMYWPPRQGT